MRAYSFRQVGFWFGWALAACLAVAPCAGAPGQSARRAATANETGEPPEGRRPQLRPVISVLTFGPGVHVFAKFGHNALRVRHASGGPDLVYNYGTFSFDSPWLLVEFLRGRLNYWLSVEPFQRTRARYRADDRTIVEQKLDLSDEQALALVRFLEWNARAENKYYAYDYYRDNCSTRVRDALDRVLGGAFRRALGGAAEQTWRDHTLRSVASDRALYVGLDVGLGPGADAPRTVWEAAFLPEVLRRAVSRFVVTAEGSGGRRLVSRERVLYQSTRAPPPERPPERLLEFLVSGLTLALLFVGAGLLGRHGVRFGRILLAMLLCLLAIIGFIGVVLVGLWTLSPHVIAHRNENALACAPWAVALLALSRGVARGAPVALSWSFRLVASAAVASAAGLALKVFPFAAQDNARIIALTLPAWWGAAIALALLRSSSERSPAST